MQYGTLAAALALFTAAAGAATTCPGASTLTIRGTVHGIQTMREEPQAEPETFFTIRVAKQICGKSEITANTIGPIACSEGEAIEASGEFTPPSEMFSIARLQLKAPVVCKGRP